MRRLVLVAAVLVILSGCSTLRGPGSYEAKQPIRELTAIVYVGGSFSDSSALNTISETSGDWEREFGIRLRVKDVRRISWSHPANPMDYPSVLKQLWEYVKDRDDYDVAIGFYREAPHEMLMSGFYGWKACIDDRWRRLIVLKHADSYDLSHELAHAFVWSMEHDTDGGGLLASMQLAVVPWVPLYLRDGTITRPVYDEIMEHKWRDFRDVVNPDVTEGVMGR